MPKLIIASGPVIIENNQVLLNKHGDDDFWKFCGGRVDEAEFNLKATAIRRVKEEMGLDIDILNNEPYFVYTEKEVDGVKVSIILVHFLAKRLNEVAPSVDIKDWRWLDISELNKENLAPNILPTLKHFGF